MQWKEISYGDFLGGRFLDLKNVRVFANCRVFAAQTEQGNHFVLILEEHQAGRLTLCEYESQTDWETDIRYLKSLPPPGGAAAGVAVKPHPVPPTRTATDAKPLPNN
jgi:hypothetical protein